MLPNQIIHLNKVIVTCNYGSCSRCCTIRSDVLYYKWPVAVTIKVKYQFRRVKCPRKTID